jgi:hypothetical protein
MKRLALAAALTVAAIVAFEIGHGELGFAILAGMLVWSLASEIMWLLSPKLWREATTMRFWMVLGGLVDMATARLR